MRPIFTKSIEDLVTILTAHVQNLFVTSYKILTGEINEYVNRESMPCGFIWRLREVMTSGPSNLVSDSVEFNDNPGCYSEKDTLLGVYAERGKRISKEILKQEIS